MEIDFHHGTTYVLARMAGFTADEAYIIAYSAQYVDDAGSCQASHSLVWHPAFFENGAPFEYIDSYHNIHDISDINEMEQHKICVPFHFLPAGIGTTLAERAVCQKAWADTRWINPLAETMVDEIVANGGNFPWGLYRLGITMHVLADTYSHQGFAGISDQVNNVKSITVNSGVYPIPGTAPPLGHAQAGHLPDIPFLQWSYTNARNENIFSNNPLEYSYAAEIMLRTLQDFKHRFSRGADPSPADVQADLRTIKKMCYGFTDQDTNARHQRWLRAINNQTFRCCPGPEKAIYVHENAQHSWWNEVEEICPRSSDPKLYAVGYRKWNDWFLTCDYYYFHVALKSHLAFMDNFVFPYHDLCHLKTSGSAQFTDRIQGAL